MARLIANTPCAGLLPKTIGTVTLSEVDHGTIALIAPFKGQKKATSDALKAAIGVSFPAPNRMVGRDTRMVWCGKDQVLLIDGVPPELPAQVINHTDAWTLVRIDGDDARAVLARLTPIDLRDGVFKRGHTARTLIAHMTGSVTRIGAKTYEIMVMRSMAGTLVHDLEQAAANVAARADA